MNQRVTATLLFMLLALIVATQWVPKRQWHSNHPAAESGTLSWRSVTEPDEIWLPTRSANPRAEYHRLETGTLALEYALILLLGASFVVTWWTRPVDPAIPRRLTFALYGATALVLAVATIRVPSVPTAANMSIANWWNWWDAQLYCWIWEIGDPETPARISMAGGPYPAQIHWPAFLLTLAAIGLPAVGVTLARRWRARRALRALE